MVFLKVDDALVRILNEYRKTKVLVDCGAGEGQLGDAMNHNGIISLELYEQETPNPRVIPADCTEFPMPAGSIPIFCRPCHSEFVHETIMNNLERCGKFLYIGLEKNLEHDLDMDGEAEIDGGDYYVRPIYSDWTGAEGEKIWEISATSFKHANEQEWLFAIDKRFDNGGCWYNKNEEGWLVNSNGGRRPLDKNMEILKTFFGSYDDLDWSDGYIDMPNEASGWLDRDGNHFGCRSRDHLDYVYMMLNTDVKTLEDHGWVRIYGPPDCNDHMPYGDFVCGWGEGMSDEQIKYLRGNGYKVSPMEERRKAAKLDNKTDWEK